MGVAALLDVWGEKLGGPRAGSEILCVLTHGMGSTPPPPVLRRITIGIKLQKTKQGRHFQEQQDRMLKRCLLNKKIAHMGCLGQ